MRYSVELKPSAERALAKLPRQEQKRIVQRMEKLADNPPTIPASTER